MDTRNVKAIHKRKSYKEFTQLADALDRGASKKEILDIAHYLVDIYRGFKYMQQANYAYESVELIVAERNYTEIKDECLNKEN